MNSLRFIVYNEGYEQPHLGRMVLGNLLEIFYAFLHVDKLLDMVYMSHLEYGTMFFLGLQCIEKDPVLDLHQECQRCADEGMATCAFAGNL